MLLVQDSQFTQSRLSPKTWWLNDVTDVLPNTQESISVANHNSWTRPMLLSSQLLRWMALLFHGFVQREWKIVSLQQYHFTLLQISCLIFLQSQTGMASDHSCDIRVSSNKPGRRQLVNSHCSNCRRIDYSSNQGFAEFATIMKATCIQSLPSLESSQSFIRKWQSSNNITCTWPAISWFTLIILKAAQCRGHTTCSIDWPFSSTQGPPR